MRYLFAIFICVSLYNCGSTVEFVPEPGFISSNPNYTRKSYKEVEIFIHKPKKRIIQEGAIYVRNFQGNLPKDEEMEALQKLLFDYKLDGAWIEKGEVIEVAPWVYQAKNASGIPMTYSEGSREMGRIKGVAFRYRK